MRKHPSILAAVLASGLLLASAPLNAAPIAGNALSKSDAASNVIEARYYGHGGHGNGAGVAAGIIGGAIIGGIIASQQPYYYGGPAYYGPGPGYYGYAAPYGGGGNWYAYCSSRYRSFDPASGTYLGYDGYRHPCQ